MRRGAQLLLLLLLLLMLVVRGVHSAEEPCLEERLLSRVDSGGRRRLRLQLRVVRFHHHHLRWRMRNDITFISCVLEIPPNFWNFRPSAHNPFLLVSKP